VQKQAEGVSQKAVATQTVSISVESRFGSDDGEVSGLQATAPRSR